jgi:hypothetical protein
LKILNGLNKGRNIANYAIIIKKANNDKNTESAGTT